MMVAQLCKYTKTTEFSTLKGERFIQYEEKPVYEFSILKGKYYYGI